MPEAEAGRAERLRLFAAIELPAAWRTYLTARAAGLERLAPGAFRWVAPELLHVTVLFLGEQPPIRLPDIERSLARAAKACPPFSLALGQLGQFGGDRPRVVWLEVRDAAGTLNGLHAALTRALGERRVFYDAKPLVAHITLGRARRDAHAAAGRSLAKHLGQMRLPAAPAPFHVEALTLMRSELGPGGPRYTPLRHWPLGGPRLADEP